MLGFAEEMPQALVPDTSAVIYASYAADKRSKKKTSLSHLCTKVRNATIYYRLYR